MAPRKAVTRGSNICGGPTAGSANVAERRGSAMPTPTEGSRTRTPRRAAARGKWSEEQLFTSDKSLLIDLDLVKLLTQPQAWNCLEESEKREILALLPAGVHPDAETTTDDPNAKIPPIPDNFIRYSNNWRDGIRQFQLDLQNGRYDPEWLHQAEDARQKRQAGDFDNFKEREYEQFWGQKQKAAMRATAGEMAHVKIKTLIDEGAFRLGDIWRFEYVYGKGPDRIFIQKESRIVKFDGVKMTFAIPPGQLVFLRGTSHQAQECGAPAKDQINAGLDMKIHPQTLTTPAASNDRSLEGTTEAPLHSGPSAQNHDDTQVYTGTVSETVAQSSNEEDPEIAKDISVIIAKPDRKENSNGLKRPTQNPPEIESDSPVKRNRGQPPKKPRKLLAPNPASETSDLEESNSTPALPSDPNIMAIADITSVPVPSLPGDVPIDLDITDEIAEQPTDIVNASISKTEVSSESEQHEIDIPASSQAQDPNLISSQSTAIDEDDIIVPNIMSPGGLAIAMLQIDGRMPNGRVANGWKDIRCIRNNQDIGSLFDVREAWFVQNEQT